MPLTIEVLNADLTTLSVDAIVNAANERMLGGGGVDGAIHAAAGPALLEACIAVPQVRVGVRCPTGEARITPAFGRLKAKFVIHTVGPVWEGGYAGEATLLASCYRSSLALAVEHGLTSIAFPAISTGVYGYPLDRAARVAAETVAMFADANPSAPRVIFVCFGAAPAAVYQTAVNSLNP